MNDGVRAERSGWRDMELSQRHRTWGFNCPCVDVDFLVVEYNSGLPVALVEYKNYRAQPPNLMHPTYRALKALAEIAKIPFVVVFYWPDVWAFRVTHVTGDCKGCLKVGEIVTERSFVTGLYRLRSFTISEHILAGLSNRLPGDDT